jgi:Arc/MetJ-type ribon-helix-helix transcriptional regulator
MSMITGMTTAKIAISLPQDLVDAVKRRVAAGEAPSVSAYIAETLREKLDERTLDDMLAEILEATGGPLTDEEKREIDAELSGPWPG